MRPALCVFALAVFGACGSQTPVEGPAQVSPTPSARRALAEHAVAEAAALLKGGDQTGAAERANYALSQEPFNRRARMVLGQIDYAAEDYAGAAGRFRSAQQLRRDLSGHEWLGLTLLQQAAAAEPTDAIALAEAAAAEFAGAVSLQPSSVNARHNLGYAHRLSGRHPQAVVVLQSVVAERPDRVVSWYELGMAHAAAGQSEAADVAFRRVLELQPTHGAARRALGD